jgi:hypothetical protein
MNNLNAFCCACYFLKQVNTWIIDSLERQLNKPSSWFTAKDSEDCSALFILQMNITSKDDAEKTQK